MMIREFRAGPNGPWLSCRAEFVTEPAVPLTAGGLTRIVAPTVATGYDHVLCHGSWLLKTQRCASGSSHEKVRPPN